jgi:hypothetical protein
VEKINAILKYSEQMHRWSPPRICAKFAPLPDEELESLLQHGPEAEHYAYTVAKDLPPG